MNNKAPLGHPSLITHLCKIAGVDTSAPPFERSRKSIDEAYYRQYCGGEEATQPVPHVVLVEGKDQHRVRHLQRLMRWSMDEFHNVVAWPEENAQGSSTGAAETSAMEDDEEHDDDDAFEDVEDNEEEEDTYDNIG
ncbi:hypothetical protein LR48_Vigan08g065500 [Vigna angularis]|uniref:Uncharacterized protein n=1 Tax=Phaseolus angularis TaxID=3914 RepID=A0A0L9V477_PHAAN|nr:hypothetical protein LR48_Vigan08g065500 [Vigna angularis]